MALIVNGEKIGDSVIEREVERLRPDYERVFKDKDPKEREAQLLDWSRENVIERVLVAQEAKKRGKRIADAEIEAALAQMKKQHTGQEGASEKITTEDEEKLKQSIELQMKVERMLQEICKDVSEPSPEVVLKFYEENKERFRSPEQVRVGHIVKHINWQQDEAAALEKIKKAQNELKQGGVFEVLAEKYSDCPENGGDLGYISRGQMVEEFEDLVFNLNVGQVSEIFRTRFGFHIAKVYDREDVVTPALEQVRQQIVAELEEQMRRETIDDFVDGLKAEAKIEQV